MPIKKLKPSDFTVVHGCVVPKLLAPALRKILAESRSSLNSCFRGEEAKTLIHSLGKHTQAELYYGYVHHKPGYYPANPPGFSTHELRNDGVAFSQWKRGAVIPWWAVGLDVNDRDVHRFIATAARHGWKVAQTYPHSSAEFHHLNFRKPPLMKRLAARVKARKEK